MKRIRSLQKWIMEWANTRWGQWALFICAFADASFLPMPTQMFLVALTLLNILNAYKYALFVTLGTLAGAWAGYSIGHFAWLSASGEFTPIAQFMFDNIPGFTEPIYQTVQIQLSKWDLGILFIAPFIPIPYKLVSISFGALDMNIFIFSLGTLVGQGLRFFLLSFLMIRFGPKIIKLLEFNKKPLVIGLTASITLVILLLKIL